MQMICLHTPTILKMKKQLSYLKKILINLFDRFSDNFLKGDLDKCLLLVNTDENAALKIKSETITNSCYEKVVGILFNNKFDFDNMSLHYAGKSPRR